MLTFNAALILTFFAVVAANAVLTFAAANVRNAAHDLDSVARERIARALNRAGVLWDTLQRGGVLLIVLTTIFSRKSSDRYVIGGCGAVLMCGATAAATAWHMRSIYAREAPGSIAQARAGIAAWGVTAAEALLIAVLIGLLSTRVNFSSYFYRTPPPEVVEVAADENDENKGLWLDEALTLQEMNWLKKDELDALAAGGGLKTKRAAGKLLYRADDIERLKKNHRRDAALPD